MNLKMTKKGLTHVVLVAGVVVLRSALALHIGGDSDDIGIVASSGSDKRVVRGSSASSYSYDYDEHAEVAHVRGDSPGGSLNHNDTGIYKGPIVVASAENCADNCSTDITVTDRNQDDMNYIVNKSLVANFKEKSACQVLAEAQRAASEATLSLHVAQTGVDAAQKAAHAADEKVLKTLAHRMAGRIESWETNQHQPAVGCAPVQPARPVAENTLALGNHLGGDQSLDTILSGAAAQPLGGRPLGGQLLGGQALGGQLLGGQPRDCRCPEQQIQEVPLVQPCQCAEQQIREVPVVQPRRFPEQQIQEVPCGGAHLGVVTENYRPPVTYASVQEPVPCAAPAYGYGVARESPSFECRAGLDTWQRGWSDLKKAWCCQHEGLGCVEQVTGPGYVTAAAPVPVAVTSPVQDQYVDGRSFANVPGGLDYRNDVVQTNVPCQEQVVVDPCRVQPTVSNCGDHNGDYEFPL